MPLPTRIRRAVPVVLPLLTLVLLVVADPGAPWRHLGLVLPLSLAAAVAASHRPWGDAGLGAGAAVLPLAIAQGGAGGGGWVALLASAAVASAAALRQGGSGRAAVRTVSGHALAALAAGVAWRSWADRLPAAAVGGVVYLTVLLAAAALRRWQRGSATLVPSLHRLGPALLMEAAAWAVGVALAAAFASDRLTGTVLVAAVALLATEAARQRGLRRRAEQRRQTLERLGHAGRRMVSTQSEVVQVVARVYRECRQLFPFSWFHFELQVGIASQPPGHWFAGPAGELQVGRPEPPRYPPPLPGIHRRGRWRILTHALEGGQRPLATLRLWCDPRRSDPEAEALLESLVPQLSSLVHRAILDEHAHRDPLTGVALRRVLDERLTESFSRARAQGYRLAVALVDLDFFKRINDRYGHAAGDTALRTVAGVLAHHLRDRDLCARYGGEEFTLLLEGLDGAAALAIADRLRQKVENLVVEHDGQRIPLTFSAGVVAYPEIQAREPGELIELADAALYEAKRLGRNCCLLYRGRGRYQDPKNRLVETEEATEVPKAPMLFA